jgi:hypothetical protein
VGFGIRLCRSQGFLIASCTSGVGVTVLDISSEILHSGLAFSKRASSLSSVLVGSFREAPLRTCPPAYRCRRCNIRIRYGLCKPSHRMITPYCNLPRFQHSPAGRSGVPEHACHIAACALPNAIHVRRTGQGT